MVRFLILRNDSERANHVSLLVPATDTGPAYDDAVNQTPTSARAMPFGQYVPQEAETSAPTSNNKEEIPAAQPRLQPPPSRPTANTSSGLVRSVAAQAEAATAALKSPPQANSSSRDSSPSGFQRMRTRKSSRNLKPSTISSPTFISSTANFDKAQQTTASPSPLSPEMQLRGKGSNSRLGRSAQQDQHGSGLNRFLSRLRKKPTNSDLASHRPASAEPTGRLGAPLVLQSEDERIMPAMSSAPPRTEFPLTETQHRKSESVGSTASQAELPSKPSTPGRAPVSYDVAKSRKRAGSASRPSQQQQSGSPSAVGSPSTNNGPWTPVDPEASMASWRSSTASSTGRPTSSAESVRKLQEAADALGLDSSRKDQLVADAAPTVETIPEEDSEYRFSKRKSNVVRRTIIVGPSASSTRISQLLQEAQEQSQSEEGESLVEMQQQPGQWPRAADQPGLRRAHTMSQMSRSSDGSQAHVPRHRKMSSDTISSRQSGYGSANVSSFTNPERLA